MRFTKGPEYKRAVMNNLFYLKLLFLENSFYENAKKFRHNHKNDNNNNNKNNK